MASTEIPGPVWHGVSHGTEYDHENEMFYVVAVIQGHRIRSHVRPMCQSEVIHSRCREFTREEMLRAYGVELSELMELSRIRAEMRRTRRPWWRFW